MQIRTMDITDIDALVHLINRAYRPTVDLRGWTHEADWVRGKRITAAQLSTLSIQPEQTLLVLEQDGQVRGCVQVSRVDTSQAQIGLLTVDPTVQTQGMGKRLLAAAEQYATQHWHSERIVMSVLNVRHELIAFYQRRGYQWTGQTAPYPRHAGVGDPIVAVSVLVLHKGLVA